MSVFNPSKKRTQCVKESRVIRLPKVIEKVKTFFNDGLLSSVVTHEEGEAYPDSKARFRDFSLQSLVQAEAYDLLKPLGTVPMDVLKAHDTANTVALSVADLKKVEADALAAAASSESKSE